MYLYSVEGNMMEFPKPLEGLMTLFLGRCVPKTVSVTFFFLAMTDCDIS